MNRISFILIYIFAWFLQSKFLFNSDVSWLMLAAKRLLAGGTYTHDFFEINPPLIIYLYIPPVILGKIINCSMLTALRVYIFFIATVSLTLCCYLAKKIFQDASTALLFLLCITAIFLIFPLAEFGQREHLLLMLTMPYFLLAGWRLMFTAIKSKNTPLCTTSAPHDVLMILIGILAGLGFAIKPYFLLPFFLVEMHFIFSKKNIFAWIRTETVTIFCVGILYSVSIFLLHPDYLTVIVPFATHIYYQKYGANLTHLVLSNQAFFTYFLGLLYWIEYEKNSYKKISTVLLLAAIGFLLAFLMQQTFWYYHFLPVLAVDCLLYLLLFNQMLKQDLRYSHYIFAIVFFGYILYRLSYIWLGIMLFPAVYFSLFFVIFLFLFYTVYAGKHYFKIISSLLVIFLVNIIFYYQLKFSISEQHLFLLTTILLFSFYFLLLSSNQIKNKFYFLSIFGVLIFSYPFYILGETYYASMTYKNLFKNLLNVMQPYKNQSILILTDDAGFAFPTIFYTQQTFASRLACFGWIPDMNNSANYADNYKNNKKLMDYFVGMINDDIKQNKPQFIFVDVRQKNSKTHLGYFGNDQIDYVSLFSQNAAFKHTWEHYHLIDTVDGQPLFKFQIFARDFNELEAESISVAGARGI